MYHSQNMAQTGNNFTHQQPLNDNETRFPNAVNRAGSTANKRPNE